MGSTGSVREEYIVCPGKEGGVSVEMDGCPQETGEGACPSPPAHRESLNWGPRPLLLLM